MANFNQTLNPTPFGLYDADVAFQRDADSMIVYVMRKLGEDVLSVELTKRSIWSAFEEATKMFNGWIIEYQTKSNLASLLGTPTGSYNPTTGLNSINLTNTYIVPNLEFLDRMAEPYANIIGFGSTQNSFSGSIALTSGIQDYDLYTDLKDSDGQPLYNMLSGSGAKMRIFEVYHFAPSPYMGNTTFGAGGSGGAVGAGYGGGGGYGTRFNVLPLHEDVLRAASMESAQRIRRSHYNYKISGRGIRIFPVPTTLVDGVNDHLWIRVGFSPTVAGGAFIDLGLSGSAGGSAASAQADGFSGQFYGASNPANIPMGLISYAGLNMWAKNWIARMTFALAAEELGRIRRKINRIPIPGSDLELDGVALVSEAREDQKQLLEDLTGKLESLSYDKLQEMETAKAENLLKQLQLMPFPPTHAIKLF